MPTMPCVVQRMGLRILSAALCALVLLPESQAEEGSFSGTEASPQQIGRVRLGEVNLVVTTDIHSWIEGRAHEPHLNATLGHIVSFVDRLREQAAVLKKDVFFLDNGDINDGTALSGLARDHVEYLSPLMKASPYDALNLGNHELYSRSQGLLPGPDCPVVGLNDSGYIASWQGRYLTSNVLWANSSQPVGNRYTVLEGRFGTRLLVFGFLYNMMDHCSAVRVENVSEVMEAAWFKEAIDQHARSCKAVVVLAHMHFEDELIDVIHAGIRSRVGQSLPIQILAGHSHMRGWRRLDQAASAYEAGCKLDTVGFTSFSPSSEGQLHFEYEDLDGNIAVIASAVGSTEAGLLTPAGRRVMDDILAQRHSIGADEVVGCSAQRYEVGASLGRPDSLWTLYMSSILPGVLFDAVHPQNREQLAIVGTGALVYDVFAGQFTVDDAYVASPFGNFWLIFRDMKGSDLAEMLKRLNQQDAKRAMLRQSQRTSLRQTGTTSNIPAYANSSAPVADVKYDLIICDFDLYEVETELKALLGSVPKFEIFKLPQNTSSVIVDWFRSQRCVDSAGTVVV